MRILLCLFVLAASLPTAVVSAETFNTKNVNDALDKLEGDLGGFEEEEVALPWVYESRALGEVRTADLTLGRITVEEFVRNLYAVIEPQGWSLGNNCQHFTAAVLTALRIDLRKFPKLTRAITQKPFKILENAPVVRTLITVGATLNNWFWPTSSVHSTPCKTLNVGHGHNPFKHKGKPICGGDLKIIQATIHWRDSWLMSSILPTEDIEANATRRTGGKKTEIEVPPKVYHAYVVLDAVDDTGSVRSRIQIERRHHVGVTEAEGEIPDVPIFSVRSRHLPTGKSVIDPLSQKLRHVEKPPLLRSKL